MRNVIILGSGRSGTSLIAGTLAKSDYFMGNDLLPTVSSNPKGIFEDIEVNSINEDILDSVIPKRPKLLGNIFFRHIPLRNQRWLAQVPLTDGIKGSKAINSRINKLVNHSPYCFKDPRFSYTLPIWRPYLSNTVFIGVFRHPGITATSILKECQADPRLHSLKINSDIALNVWFLMYQHIVEKHSNEGRWLFIHYEQVFSSEGLERIADFTKSDIDRSFPERKFNRTKTQIPISTEIRDLYATLCNLANYRE